MAMITDIEDFFTLGCGRCDRFATPACVTRHWHDGLVALRDICRATGLSEEVKWAHPCYVFQGRNVALITALKGDFRLNFFNPALMTDPDGVMERQGPNTRHKDTIRFTDNAQVAALENTIRAYLDEAIGYARAGIVAPRETPELELPAELVDALDADPELAEAFSALTPGRQRSYVFNLNAARQSATRSRRIEGFRPRILAGKGAQER